MFESFDRPVWCKDGHLFTTIWIPLGSLKAIRWFDRRYQYCPVGHPFTAVFPVKTSNADEGDLERAALVHDIRIP